MITDTSRREKFSTLPAYVLLEKKVGTYFILIVNRQEIGRGEVKPLRSSNALIEEDKDRSAAVFKETIICSYY